MGLTDKQKRFCDEYLIDLNATQAAIRAGYVPNGINKRVTRMMANDGIQKYISERISDRKKRVEVTQDDIIRELSYIAFSKASDYAKVVEKEAHDECGNLIYDENGEVLKYRTVEPMLTDELTEEQKRAIAVIKKGRDGFEIKPYDKQRALELLGKHLGMFTDKVEVSGTVNDPFDDLSTEELKKLIDDD